MTDDERVILNLPGNEEPVTEMFIFITIDEQGREGVCSTQINNTHYPMITTRKHIVEKMRPIARMISQETGKPVKLLRFTTREELDTISAGLNS